MFRIGGPMAFLPTARHPLQGSTGGWRRGWADPTVVAWGHRHAGREPS